MGMTVRKKKKKRMSIKIEKGLLTEDTIDKKEVKIEKKFGVYEGIITESKECSEVIPDVFLENGLKNSNEDEYHHQRVKDNEEDILEKAKAIFYRK